MLEEARNPRIWAPSQHSLLPGLSPFAQERDEIAAHVQMPAEKAEIEWQEFFGRLSQKPREIPHEKLVGAMEGQLYILAGLSPMAFFQHRGE